MFDVLNNHFSLLDQAPISKASIFQDEMNKQTYETLLMYSFRKLKAAEYHFDNVKSFIAREQQTLDSTNPPNLESNKKIKYSSSIKVSRPADEYIYELSAFLEALKSALDMLAEVCSFYLPGIQVNYSISPLLKLVGKGKKGLIFDEIAYNLRWLTDLREYRHHLVHRLMPTVNSGYEAKLIGNKTAKASYPVVVPIRTPAFVIDTRSRQMEEAMLSDETVLFPGLSFGSSTMKFIDTDGVEHIHQFDIHVAPAEGYDRIETFMEVHLKTFIAFSQQLILAFEKLGFQPVQKEGG